MNRGLRYGLTAGAALAALAIALPWLIPADAYKSQIEEVVSRATGRSFTIRGPLHFTLFPMAGMRAENVALANVRGGRAPAMVTADDVRVSVQLAPLFSGRILVSTIVLDHPVIALEVDAAGRGNWTISRPGGANPGGKPAPSAFHAQFAGLQIVGGKVSYRNARTGSARAFDGVDAKLAFTELAQPAVLDGGFDHAGHRVTVHATLATPEALLQDRPTALDLSVASDLLRARFKGTVSAEGRGTGTLAIDAPSARQAAVWLGARLPNTGGLNALSLRSDFQGDNRTARFSALRLTLDGMTLTGGLALDTGGDVPAVRGALSADHLNLDPYIERPQPHGAPTPRHNAEEWSEKPITLGLLKKLDADLTLDTGPLTVRKLSIAKAHIALTLAGAHLQANIDPMTLYGGIGKARLDVGASGATPMFHNVLHLQRVALQPFLSDTIGVRQIEGTGDIALDLSSRGDSARAIMGGLDGSGSIEFRDGRLRGVNLGAVARTIQHLLGSSANAESFTDYANMGATFTLSRGVLDNRDFHLDGPLLKATGSGKVDIGGRTIDFRIEPVATASLGHEKLALGVPFHITGPWRHLHYHAEVEKLVNGVIQNLEAGRAPFKGLFGKSSGDKPASPDKKKHKNLGEALKNMFGIH
jgi:AsmA protein